MSAIFAKIKAYTAILRRFSQILLKFLQILHGFSPNQKYWVCVCTRASYASDFAGCGKFMFINFALQVSELCRPAEHQPSLSWRFKECLVISKCRNSMCRGAARMRPKRPWPLQKKFVKIFRWCFISISTVQKQTEGTVGLM